MGGEKFRNKYRIPSARWRNWDYANEGAYYVTVCCKNMIHYFGEVVDAEMHYSALGEIALEEWLKTSGIRADMCLDMDCFQIMPNHFHAIVVIGKNEFNSNRSGVGVNHFGPQSKNLASIMRGFKSAVTTRARTLNIPFAWHERFYDHVIRDDEEFRRIASYIEENAAK
jgi:REP element-mobilizing transposase RayT